jgi:transposase
MPGKAAKVTITERQQEILDEFSRSRSEPYFLRQRATIILLAFAGRLNEQIAPQVGLERHQVGIWRTRWAEAFDRLVLLECLDGPTALAKAIRELLADAPRPGSPGKFTAEQLAQIFACACEDPQDSGYPFTHWTHADLAREVVNRGIVASISVRHLGRLLDEADLKPHRIRYWLNAKQKDDPSFLPQVQLVCATYTEAPQLYQQFHTHTISTDEMTGIQALQRIAATKRTQPGREARREFEYKRHGTQTLIANFHVVTGQVISPTVHDTRTEEDFVKHVERTVATDPESGWVIVTDQLNIHQSEALVRLVARACGIAEETLGKKGKRGVLKSLKSRKEFLSEPSHRIRFVYTPKHSSWLNQVEIWFSILARRVIRRGNFTSKEDLRAKILAFIDYFNQVMAKPFKWTFTGQVLKA